MLSNWSSGSVDSPALTVHRLLVALWSAAAIYFPPLCLLLTCYEIIAVLLNTPLLMANREIQGIAALFQLVRKWTHAEQEEINPLEVKKIIEEVVQGRKTAAAGIENKGDCSTDESEIEC